MSQERTATGSSRGSYTVAATVESTTMTPATVVIPTIDLRRYEVRKGILDQYLRAAKRGEISFLKYYRLRKGIDQKTLANLADMTQSAVARAERPGQIEKMKGHTLRRLARALNVRVDDLLQ